MGPALMLKTKRGRGFLDRVGRFRRLWSVVGDVGIILNYHNRAVVLRQVLRPLEVVGHATSVARCELEVVTGG
ncbi:MAG: hypothetical protein L3J96_07550, partial [Thermoplasmata archaeon]|nr:hypothetical protein [Thermoplasmata archaeon]